MDTFISKEIQAGLDAARKESLKKASRLRIDADGDIHPVLRMWKTGFALDADTAPHLRGFVDIYDGAIHLFQCLIVATDEEQGELRFEFKRATAVSKAPAADFEIPDNSPVALIEKASRA